MGELDESVRVALRERAEGAVGVEELLTGARRRGVRRRRGRHALLGAATAAAVAAVTAAGMSLVSATGPVRGGGGQDAAESQVVSTLPRPPQADPGDGNAVRLDVSDPDANQLEWFTEGDKQSLHVGRVRSWLGVQGYQVTRARNQTELEAMVPEQPEGSSQEVHTEHSVVVGGGIGTLSIGERWAFLRWLRSDGMWIGVAVTFTDGADPKPDEKRRAARQVARWVRADVAYRCVLDFRLSWTPPGSRPIGCVLSIAPGHRRYGQAISTDNRKIFTMYTEPARNVKPLEANTSVGDRPVELGRDQARYQFGDRVFEIAVPNLPAEDALKMVSGFTPLQDPIPEK